MDFERIKKQANDILQNKMMENLMIESKESFKLILSTSEGILVSCNYNRTNEVNSDQ